VFVVRDLPSVAASRALAEDGERSDRRSGRKQLSNRNAPALGTSPGIWDRDRLNRGSRVAADPERMTIGAEEMAHRPVRLFDHLSEDMRATEVVAVGTASEVLLGARGDSLERLKEALRPARFIVGHKGELVPFDPDEPTRYVVAERRGGSGPSIRTNVLQELQTRHNADAIDAWVWGPTNDPEPGTWDERSRTFSSKFSRIARQQGITIPPDVVAKHSLTDEASLEKALGNGDIVLLGPTTLDIAPTGPLNRLSTPMLESPPDIPTINVAYRGAAQRHPQPLLPSFYREFRNPVEATKADRIRVFASNLVMETVADEFGDLLTHNEAESVVQHYKILPWTLMIDLSLDLNVAKAFAALSHSAEKASYLYQVVVWNLGVFDTGVELVDRLRLARPIVQAAVAQFGFALDDVGRALDRYGLLISVTEHVLNNDGAGWERFDGNEFSLRGERFEVPLREAEQLARVKHLLYPRETDPRAQAVLARIVAAMDRQLHRFADIGKVRTRELEQSLALIRAAIENPEA
jgi:hypothetical protein